MPRRAGSTIYGLASVDPSGRVGDRMLIRALDWAHGTRLEPAVDAGRLIIVRAPSGVHRVSTHGFVRLPARLRRCRGIEAGDRVLLAAEPTTGVLVVYPLVSMDALRREPVEPQGVRLVLEPAARMGSLLAPLLVAVVAVSGALVMMAAAAQPRWLGALVRAPPVDDVLPRTARSP